MATIGKSLARFIPFKAEILSEDLAILVNDDLLKFCLRSGTQLAERYCKNNLYQRNASLNEYIDGDGSRKLRLRHVGGNVPLINTVVIVYEITSDGTQTVLAASNYRVDPSGFLFRLSDVWAIGERNYRVDYNPGWDVDLWETDLFTSATWEVPEDLEKAVMHIAAWDYKMNYGSKGNSQLGIQSLSTTEKSITFQNIQDIIPSAASVLKNYRRSICPL